MEQKILSPKISNWKDLVEQFGLRTPLGKNYKTAVEISRDLTFANERIDLNDKREQPRPQKDGIMTFVSQREDEMTCVTIAYERDNFDSGVCNFEFVGMEGERRVYDYLGTAK